MLHSSLLSELAWVQHGFGTRRDTISQDTWASLRQIHSAAVLTVSRAGCAGEGDALITGAPRVTLSVRTADCYPVLLADTRNRAVAAVHAGWRGSAARIVVEALAAMEENFGTAPADVYAVIGPGIGVCCYQVGAEVASQFGRAEAGRIDLAAANRSQLLAAGVPGDAIEILGGCTRCDAAQFHSFRRDREQAGRMVSYIGIG